jgi:hypothetical protein
VGAVAWIVVGAALWLVAGLWLALLFGRVVRERDAQVPTVPVSPRSESAPMSRRR